MSANADQIRYWNEKAGPNWTAQQALMDSYLAEIGTALLGFAAARRGMRVLDVGCGTGTTSLALAGAGAKVTGVDVSKPMLALARARAAKAGLAIDFIEADASAYALAPDFDLVFSRFGVMFFDDPAAAFANLRKALKPGGRLAFACWRTPPENPWASAPLAAARPFLPAQPPVDPLAPGPFAFADPARVEDILARGGFSHIDIRKCDGVMNLGPIDLAAGQMLLFGPLSRIVGEVDDSTRANIVAAVRDTLGRFAAPDGNITPPTASWLVSARA